MNILIIGSGGREHALTWKLAQSPNCKKIFNAPGNAGTESIATNLAISPTDFDALSNAIDAHQIDMLIVGPEDPLVQGIVDFFRALKSYDQLIIIGPDKAGAQLEGSKDFSKSFMKKYNIPTAKSKTFTPNQLKNALTYVRAHSYPLVLKADGLAAGKGVIIAQNLDEAEQGLNDILINKKFNEAGNKVVIEDFLKGIELSVFVLSDGQHYLILPEAKDYKRIGEKDTGLNTGGMGAVSPVPFATVDFMNKVEEKVIKPTMYGLSSERIDFIGFLFIGLMNINGEPFVIEYNVRMGDPETQVIIPRIESDLVSLFEATANKKLNEFSLSISNKTATTVVAVAGGYPSSYTKGDEISGLNDNLESTMVFMAGAKNATGKVLTDGGRILTVTALANNLSMAQQLAYKRLKKISWEEIYYRRDIADDLLNLPS